MGSIPTSVTLSVASKMKVELMDHYNPEGLTKLPLAALYPDGISEIFNYPNLAGPYQSKAYFEGTKRLLDKFL